MADIADIYIDDTDTKKSLANSYTKIFNYGLNAWKHQNGKSKELKGTRLENM